MNDCVNAEMRDRLPDLLHERLDDAARASVIAHIEGCADCQAELALLRGLHEMLMRTAPRVDVARIAGAIPSRRVAARSRWTSWRVAAAAVLVVLGGTSLTLMNQKRGDVVLEDSAVAVTEQVPATTEQPAGVTRRGVETARPLAPDSQPSQRVARGAEPSDEGLEMTGRLGELTDDELRQLLEEIDEMEALPLPDPEPTVLPITSKRITSPVGT